VEQVIDNTDPGFSTTYEQDEWITWEAEDNQQLYGSDHRSNRQLGDGSDVATWAFTVTPGRYEVFAWWYASGWRPTDVPYTVYHADGATTTRVDQTRDGGQWNSLGVYRFDTSGRVTLSDDCATGDRGVIADAIRVVLVGAAPVASPTATSAPQPTATATALPTATPTSPPTLSTPRPTPNPRTVLSYGASDCGRQITIPNGDYARLLINASCSAQSPLTIRAQTDGGVRFDGRNMSCSDGLCPVCSISGSSNVTVEGIVCHHSNDMVVSITNSSSIRLNRVTAYQAGPDYSDHVFEINRSQNVTLTDCAATGRGRNPYIAYESDAITMRRVFARYLTNGSEQGADNFQLYGSADCLLENFVGVREPSGIYVDAGQFWYATWNRAQDRVDRNQIVGSVFAGYDYHGLNVISANQQLSGNGVQNTVFVGNDTSRGYGTPYSGVFQRCDNAFQMDRLTLVNHQIAVSQSHDTSNPWFDIIGTLTNSSIVNANTGINVASYSQITTRMDHRYNNFFNVAIRYAGTMQGVGETQVNPGYDTSRYGTGAYLFVPPALQGRGEGGADVGAEVRYQSVDGTLTNQRLWPWPLEARICAETDRLLGQGISVTYESHQAQYDYDGDGQVETYNCSGGLWRTLEGVYP